MPIKKAIAIGLVGFAINCALSGPWALSSSIRETADAEHLGDFTHFYVGACLGGSPAEYDSASVLRLQQSLTGVLQPHLMPSRLPFYYGLLHPLCRLPYYTAHRVWLTLISLAAVAAVGVLGSLEGSVAIIAALWSAPLFLSIMLAQDDSFVLLALAAGLWLRRSGRPIGGGLVLSLLWIKFHLFVLLPVVFLAKREFRLLQGALIGSVALLGSCFLIAGPGWVTSYLALLRNPVINLGPELMPNLHGLAVRFGEPGPVEAAAGVVVLIAAIWSILRAEFPFALAAALLGGMLVSHHAYSFDCSVLLPALVILWRDGQSPARELALIAMLPFPYWLAGILGLGWVPAGLFAAMLAAVLWGAWDPRSAVQTKQTVFH